MKWIIEWLKYTTLQSTKVCKITKVHTKKFLIPLEKYQLKTNEYFRFLMTVKERMQTERSEVDTYTFGCS